MMKIGRIVYLGQDQPHAIHSGAKWVQVGDRRVDLPAAVNGWQPIETAPKDGTRILLTDGSLISIGSWLRENYTADWTNEAEPQHTDGPGAVAGYWRSDPIYWMPLPAPKK